ncbi:MAG: hypothetical protein GY847_37140 [Proteobacteria bacterium]|nr:hypothetical protein [Pseudomonadota bacterium]
MPKRKRQLTPTGFGIYLFSLLILFTFAARSEVEASDAGIEEETSDASIEEASLEEIEKASLEKKVRSSPPVNFRGTETFIVDYVGDNGNLNETLYGDDDNYWTFRNMFYLQAGNRDFDSAIRLDATLFHNPPYYVEEFIPGGDGYTTLNYDNDYRVERLHGTMHVRDLHVTIGDFYVNFGRGMALSLIKLDDVGVDNALRGARLEYRLPRVVKAVLVGGVVNSLNIDPLTHQVQSDDPLDRIVGGRIEWEIQDALSLGVHGVLMQPRFTDEADIQPRRLYVDQSTGIGVANGGASLELHLGGLHVYLEGNGQKHDNYRTPIGEDDVLDESGYAAFGEASYDLSPFNIKAEGIFYRHWLMEGPLRGSANNIGATQPLTYHHMVTLEPMWMVIKSFGNAGGGRLTGDLYLSDSDTQFVLASSLIKYNGGLMPQGTWTDHPPTLVAHPTLKVRQGFKDTGIYASAEGGFRYETTDEPEVPEHEDGTLWHIQGDVSVPITGPHSVELKVEVRRHRLKVTEGNDYWVTLTSLGYDWSGLFGLSAIHEFSDETGGSESKLGSWTLPLPLKHYVWGMATVHGPAPLNDLTVRLLGGSQRGGIKCAGGICRRYPDAVGVRLEAVYRF